jgi:hypothetical protein
MPAENRRIPSASSRPRFPAMIPNNSRCRSRQSGRANVSAARTASSKTGSGMVCSRMDWSTANFIQRVPLSKASNRRFNAKPPLKPPREPSLAMTR